MASIQRVYLTGVLRAWLLISCYWAFHRREQDQDCQIWCFGAIDPAGKVEGYEGPEKCYWSAFEHDA